MSCREGEAALSTPPMLSGNPRAACRDTKSVMQIQVTLHHLLHQPDCLKSLQRTGLQPALRDLQHFQTAEHWLYQPFSNCLRKMNSMASFLSRGTIKPCRFYILTFISFAPSSTAVQMIMQSEHGFPIFNCVFDLFTLTLKADFLRKVAWNWPHQPVCSFLDLARDGGGRQGLFSVWGLSWAKILQGGWGFSVPVVACV